MSGDVAWGCEAPQRAHRPPRVYAPTLRAASGSIALTEDEAHHLTRVLRCRIGDPVELFDGDGHSAPGRVAGIRARGVWVEFGPISSDPVPTWSATLVAGVLKGDKRDEIVRAAVALGWDQVVFVPTRYSQIRDFGSEHARWAMRWHAVAVAAAKQCGRNRLPRIEVVGDWETVVHSIPAQLSCVGSAAPSAARLVDLLRSCAVTSRRVGRFVVGPEGGLAPDEEAWLVSQGFVPARWAPYILRSELAAIALMASVAAEWGA